MFKTNVPWEVVSSDIVTISPEQLLELSDRNPQTPVEITSVNEFFVPALRQQAGTGKRNDAIES